MKASSYFILPGTLTISRKRMKRRDKEALKKKRCAELEKIIIDCVCSQYKVSLEKMKVKTRKRDIRWPRQVCCYLLKYFYGKDKSLGQIAELFYQDHATVISARKTVENLRLVHQEERTEIIRLKIMIVKKLREATL